MRSHQLGLSAFVAPPPLFGGFKVDDRNLPFPKRSVFQTALVVLHERKHLEEPLRIMCLCSELIRKPLIPFAALDGQRLMAVCPAQHLFDFFVGEKTRFSPNKMNKFEIHKLTCICCRCLWNINFPPRSEKQKTTTIKTHSRKDHRRPFGKNRWPWQVEKRSKSVEFIHVLTQLI